MLGWDWAAGIWLGMMWLIGILFFMTNDYAWGHLGNLAFWVRYDTRTWRDYFKSVFRALGAMSAAVVAWSLHQVTVHYIDFDPLDGVMQFYTFAIWGTSNPRSDYM